MFRNLVLAGALISAAQVAAQDNAAHCDALFQEMKASTSSDPNSCIPVVEPTAALKQCYLPFDYNGDRKASHIVLILDASGSMAGRVNGKPKMDLAKQESTTFMKNLANDLPVGLMVYGHKGNNQESGKAESCQGIEMVLPIGESRNDISNRIAGLSPTGWTPLASALAFAEAELGNQPPVAEGEESAPVVYLVSDGEETCGGDPVEAARSLHQSGVQATVNVIGFDVDDATRAQLEAISQAGGGQFFAAKDAKALRDHLNAASAAELSHALFKKCLAENQGTAIRPIHRALLGFPACISRETRSKFNEPIVRQINALSTPEDKACSLNLYARVGDETRAISQPLLDMYDKMVKDQNALGEAAIQFSIENALPSKR